MSLDTRDGQSFSSGGSLGDTFYPLYEYLFDSEGDFVSGIENKLAQARMPQNVELFLARALGVGALAGLALWLVGSMLGYAIFILFLDEAPVILGLPKDQIPAVVQALKVPLLIFVTGIVFGLIGFGIGFGSMISIPYFRAGARKREINVLLSDAISFMYALSVGGLNQLEILQAMARADDTYGEVSKEFQSIVLETEYFDTDYRTAIRNQALQTPSDELAQFLTDMLSIVDSGGDMTGFLEDQKEKHMRTAKQEQKQVLETMELFGEMYMTLSLFPLLLIIILVIMSMMGDSQQMLLLGTVYGLIPLTGIGFLVLVSTITQDEIGDGYLRPEGKREDVVVREGLDVLNLGLIERYTGEYGVFKKIKGRERSYEVNEIFAKPHIFFRDNPTVVLLATVPLSVLALLIGVLWGMAPLTPSGFVDYPVRSTFFWIYVPLYINFVPLMIFYEWNVRARRGVVGQLSENLRKLSSANDTGMTLLESMKVVSETSSGKLADEFETMYAKVNYGTGLRDAMREFNNKYHIPRLARTVKLISKAQEASSQIQDVLTTAAQASENQDDIERERISRTRMQVAIIIMTYLTLLGVMALLKTQFLDVMAGLANQASSGGGGGGAAAGGAGGGQFGGNVDTDLLSLLFFHAVTLQAILSSFIAGYIRDVDLISGVKFAVILPTIALITWIAIA
ncbi:type II secretion system F family protein [Halorientalis salina]|uniref:type II secretion system F family protein n=1 Tax=Halorientalis salina TaxID=2932266 RepID=UPI0010ABAA68|nr:type II secretion system F family protein [Halorientalis salina]